MNNTNLPDKHGELCFALMEIEFGDNLKPFDVIAALNTGRLATEAVTCFRIYIGHPARWNGTILAPFIPVLY
jgi:hypothetical protein